MRILDYNHCISKSCGCGWNVMLAGKSEEELLRLKRFVIEEMGIEADDTKYGKKVSMEPFNVILKATHVKE